MHELAVTTSVLTLSLEHAQNAHITDIHLVIGQLSSMVDDSVQFYWDIISQGTAAEGARLHFQRIAAELECSACGRRYGLTGDDFLCPECGSAQVRVTAGEEFYLEAIDVEEVVEKEAVP
jgi:hydrogenase nickel incorporation protein HypA/HybF